MMQALIINSIQFFLFLFLNQIYSQKFPEHHRPSILQEGIQIVNEINPHELFIHQFEAQSGKFKFFFHAIDKHTLVYNLYTDNVTDLLLTEQELISKIYSTHITHQTIIKTYSNFEINVDTNTLSNEEQKYCTCLLSSF